MQQLTDLQRETLEFIRGFVRINGFAPSRPEIAKALKIKHKSGVDSRLFALERKAWIELKPGSPRYIRLLDDDLPLIVGGSVAAGEPILAEERVTARIPRSVAEAFRSQPDFFVRVEGDSLDRLGFVTGSVVGIKAQSDAENGEVIVARLGDQVTLKRYFRKDERHVELRPESTNPEHQPIMSTSSRRRSRSRGSRSGRSSGTGSTGLSTRTGGRRTVACRITEREQRKYSRSPGGTVRAARLASRSHRIGASPIVELSVSWNQGCTLGSTALLRPEAGAGRQQ